MLILFEEVEIRCTMLGKVKLLKVEFLFKSTIEGVKGDIHHCHVPSTDQVF